MKKTLLVVILAIFMPKVNIQAQIIINFNSKKYIPCEITFDDNTVVSGFIKDFRLPKTIEITGYELSTIESELNLDRSKFKFKSTQDSKAEDLTLSDIKYITLIEEDGQVKYEKLHLKTINSKSEVVDLKREVMVPLLREGSINLYGLQVYECSGGCIMLWILAYIKHPDSEYAYIPIDYNGLNLFNVGKLQEKIFRSFEEVGKDCEDFANYMKELSQTKMSKDEKKEAKEEYRAFQKKLKDELKSVKGAKNKRQLEDDLYTEYFLGKYIKVIDEYDNRCGKS
ncbi:MAG: hypothetical protein WCY89_09200 [Flavobacteriaceae bacterium]